MCCGYHERLASIQYIYIYIYILLLLLLVQISLRKMFAVLQARKIINFGRNGCCILAFYIAICAADFGSIDSSMIVYVRLWVHWSHKRQFFV